MRYFLMLFMALTLPGPGAVATPEDFNKAAKAVSVDVVALKDAGLAPTQNLVDKLMGYLAVTSRWGSGWTDGFIPHNRTAFTKKILYDLWHALEVEWAKHHTVAVLVLLKSDGNADQMVSSDEFCELLGWFYKAGIEGNNDYVSRDFIGYLSMSDVKRSFKTYQELRAKQPKESKPEQFVQKEQIKLPVVQVQPAIDSSETIKAQQEEERAQEFARRAKQLSDQQEADQRVREREQAIQDRQRKENERTQIIQEFAHQTIEQRLQADRDKNFAEEARLQGLLAQKTCAVALDRLQQSLQNLKLKLSRLQQWLVSLKSALNQKIVVGR